MQHFRCLYCVHCVRDKYIVPPFYTGFSLLFITTFIKVPYAKYLDCGADMFHEIITTHWLTAADGHSSSESTMKRPPAGLVIRLQGFDRGVFGGNFHTHNSLPLPPGLDVVVFSNGGDWVKGWRHALAAAIQVPRRKTMNNDRMR